MDQETPKTKIVQFRAHQILKITHKWLKDNFRMSENDKVGLLTFMKSNDIKDFPELKVEFPATTFCFIDDMAKRIHEQHLNKLFLSYDIRYDIINLPAVVPFILNPEHVYTIGYILQNYTNPEFLTENIFYFFKTQVDDQYSEQLKETAQKYYEIGDQIHGRNSTLPPDQFEFKKIDRTTNTYIKK